MRTLVLAPVLLFSAGCAGAPLNRAVIDGNPKRALELVDAGAAVNREYSTGCTVLALAASVRGGDLELVKALVARGAVVSPGILNCEMGHVARYASTDVVRFLVEHGADPDTRTKYSVVTDSPLLNAALGGNRETIAYLLDRGADGGFAVMSLSKLASRGGEVEAEARPAVELLSRMMSEHRAPAPAAPTAP